MDMKQPETIAISLEHRLALASRIRADMRRRLALGMVPNTKYVRAKND